MRAISASSRSKLTACETLAWQALSGNLVQFLKDQRAERFRLQEERALESRHEHLLEVYPEFRLTKPFGAILPGPCDIAKSVPYLNAVKAVPFDQDMPRQAILDILKSLPQSYFEDWRAQCEQELVTFIEKRIDEPISLPMPARTVREVIGTQTVTRDILSLATVNFWYGMDGRGITSPSVLMWPRFGLYHYDDSWYPWSTERIRFANVGQLMALRMVELLGKDPHKTTAEEMDRLDPWYYIDKPGSIKDGMHIVYSWRCVVSHAALVGIAQRRLTVKSSSITSQMARIGTSSSWERTIPNSHARSSPTETALS